MGPPFFVIQSPPFVHRSFRTPHCTSSVCTCSCPSMGSRKPISASNVRGKAEAGTLTTWHRTWHKARDCFLASLAWTTLATSCNKFPSEKYVAIGPITRPIPHRRTSSHLFLPATAIWIWNGMCTPKLPSNNWENDHQQLRCAFF